MFKGGTQMIWVQHGLFIFVDAAGIAFPALETTTFGAFVVYDLYIYIQIIFFSYTPVFFT